MTMCKQNNCKCNTIVLRKPYIKGYPKPKRKLRFDRVLAVILGITLLIGIVTGFRNAYLDSNYMTALITQENDL